LTLSPTEGITPGKELTIQATGLRPYESASLSIDTKSFATVYANDKGEFSYGWSYIINTESGDHTLAMTTSSSNQTKSVTFVSNATKLPAPGNLNASPPDVMSVTLTWDAVEGAYNYAVYRKAASENEFSLLTDKAYYRTYTDTSVSKDVVYTYEVAAIDRYGLIGNRSISAIAQPLPDNNPLRLEYWLLVVTVKSDLVATVTMIYVYKKSISNTKSKDHADSTYVRLLLLQ
jgi:hypothetical protein